MAKTAATASWRTLTRQADKERNPRKASRLRKQAHELRRAEREAATLNRSKRAVKATASIARRTVKSLAREAHKAGLAVQISSIPRSSRAAKGWATRRANQVRAANAASRNQAMIATTPGPDLSQARSYTSGQTATDRGAPGHGEVVGGVYAEIAERIVKLARKKSGMNGIYNEIAALAQSSKYEGCVETDKAATARLIEVQERLAERVVCGFLAEVDQAVHEHRGLPLSMVWSVNSFVITKIADALNKHGYTSSGMRNAACGQVERAVGR